MRTLAVVFFTLLSQACFAGSVAMGDQLAHALRLEDQYRELQDLCLAQGKTANFEKLLGVGPDDALRAGSPHWPKVVAAYDDYFAATCLRPSKEEYRRMMAAAYAATLTDDEMAELIAFHQRSPGSALVSAQQAASRRISAEIMQSNAARTAAAYDAFNQRIRAIRAEANPESNILGLMWLGIAITSALVGFAFGWRVEGRRGMLLAALVPWLGVLLLLIAVEPGLIPDRKQPWMWLVVQFFAGTFAAVVGVVAHFVTQALRKRP